MELSNKENIKEEYIRSNKTQMIFLILIGILIFVLVFTIFYFIKNNEIIKTDPFIYGMKQHNFSSCSCFDSSGTGMMINGNLSQPTKFYGNLSGFSSGG